MVAMWFRGENGETINAEVHKSFFDTENNLIYIGKTDDSDTSVVRLPKGSWDIMDAIVPKILKYVPGCIVEIGMGESSTIFADHAYQADVALYSCDLKIGGMFEVFDKPLFEKHSCFIGRSEDFIQEFDDKPSIVFLDGEHNYETVKMELDFFLPILNEGGVIFMHDTFPPYEHHLVKDSDGFKPGDVYLARKELENNPEIDILTFPYSAHGMGLTMVMKHKKNDDRPYWRKNGRVPD